MLTIRLQRTGRKNDPHFRAVVIDSKEGPKSGNFIEKLGSYNPKAGEIILDAERVKYWIKVGAKTSDTMHNFLISKKIIEGKKVNVLSKKSPTKKRKEIKAEKK
ncbi:MAG: 30S ribosomal protein S16 [Candidatus Nomurabacteria bacterium GW2011_GWB1_37_5]|uniref:Small ribosomal subunit protein bS16 n=1 Tax=Candidatus Nomurabacteria bacterium GW2011_GWB1_37_5 TaxID=1618742 RepID=A0A0G0HBM6_9BACT|nr:MAG: 30S ribosomal protein S16 [Candidatus Nomurabacteria bacterium GW2011_GWB1_37_5]